MRKVQALTIGDLRAISDAVAAVRRDRLAMQEYLRPGSTGPNAPLHLRITTPAQVDRDAKAGAFDSPEREHYKALIRTLSPEAMRELLAIINLGRPGATDFDGCYDGSHYELNELSHANEDFAGYVLGRAARYLSTGLAKLGIII